MMRISPQRRAEMEDAVLSDRRTEEIRGDVAKLEKRSKQVEIGPLGMALLASVIYLTEERIRQSRMISELLEASKEPAK
ncbi:hypothetical protein [Hyphomonas sp.]|uniref:hypothetical protein n=1 Tax=Hyphomonas sp. TaxID=87 RepID=UPI003001B2AA